MTNPPTATLSVTELMHGPLIPPLCGELPPFPLNEAWTVHSAHQNVVVRWFRGQNDDHDAVEFACRNKKDDVIVMMTVPMRRWAEILNPVSEYRAEIVAEVERSAAEFRQEFPEYAACVTSDAQARY